jgi:hypothetical protein
VFLLLFFALAVCRGASLQGDEAAQLRYSNQQRAAAGAFDHLKSLKDVFTVNLTPNPDCELQQQQQRLQDGSSNAAADNGGVNVPLWVCPITLLPCGSKQPFSALKPCGHVLSDKALAAVSAADCACPMCGKEFSRSKDVVQINGSPEHMEEVRKQLKAKAAAKAAVKARAANAGQQRKRTHEAIEGGSSGVVRAVEGEQEQQQQQQQQTAQDRLLLTCSINQDGNAAVPQAAGHRKEQQQQLQQRSGLQPRLYTAARASL